MTRFTNRLGMLLAGLVFLAACGTAPATERHFKLKGEGSLLGDPFAGDAPFEASGTAIESTGLGNWTNSGFLTFEFVGNEVLAYGTIVFEAADGAELYATFEGSIDLEDMVGTAVVTWVGGTGRYASATGTADMVVLQDPAGPFTFKIKGAIDY
jgi:hypothetical protein